MLEQGDISRLQLLLKERDNDIEHKLNVVASLNFKLSAFEDMKKDVAQNQEIFRQSEASREQLQIRITQTANELKKDTEMKVSLQEQLQYQINELMDRIQQ